MNKSLALCSLLFLAGCGSQHALGTHTVRDLGDAHWIGDSTGTGAYLTPSQFAEIAKISEDSLVAEGPAQLFNLNINVGPDAEAQWKQRGPFEEAGTTAGLSEFHKDTSAGEARYYRLPAPASGFISCLPVKASSAGMPCLLQITYHGVNAGMPIEPRAIANWSEINTGLQNIVSAAVDSKCLVGGFFCS